MTASHFKPNHTILVHNDSSTSCRTAVAAMNGPVQSPCRFHHGLWTRRQVHFGSVQNCEALQISPTKSPYILFTCQSSSQSSARHQGSYPNLNGGCRFPRRGASVDEKEKSVWGPGPDRRGHRGVNGREWRSAKPVSRHQHRAMVPVYHLFIL